MKIKITETGQREIAKLGVDVEQCIESVISFIPKQDLIGLGHIFITDKPSQSKKRLATAAAAYFQKYQNRAAYIEVYLSKLYSHFKSSESFLEMFPIQSVGLAGAVFHEVGHHVEKIRSHGINKKTREKFAEKYANKLLSKYLIANEKSISSCFENLEKIAKEKGLSKNALIKMKNEWETQFNKLAN